MSETLEEFKPRYSEDDLGVNRGLFTPLYMPEVKRLKLGPRDAAGEVVDSEDRVGTLSTEVFA